LTTGFSEHLRHRVLVFLIGLAIKIVILGHDSLEMNGSRKLMVRIKNKNHSFDYRLDCKLEDPPSSVYSVDVFVSCPSFEGLSPLNVFGSGSRDFIA